MAIEMFCDHCEKLIPHDINGGVRLKLGKKEYTFHLCGECQVLLRKEIKEVFLDGADWREVG
jgi:RNase P subunit RPR2